MKGARARIRMSAGALGREALPARSALTAEASPDELREAEPVNRMLCESQQEEGARPMC